MVVGQLRAHDRPKLRLNAQSLTTVSDRNVCTLTAITAVRRGMSDAMKEGDRIQVILKVCQATMIKDASIGSTHEVILPTCLVSVLVVGKIQGDRPEKLPSA